MADAGADAASSPQIPAIDGQIGHRRATLDIHEHLRSLIVSGALPPGSRLVQTDVARQLGISRIPLREAFRMLQQEGLIEANPDQRAIVAALDLETQDGIWACRILQETLAARLTVGSLTPADIAALDRSVRGMERATVGRRTPNPMPFHEHHDAFHDCAGAGAGRFITRSSRELHERTRTYAVEGYFSDRGHWRRIVSMHQDILEAIRARDVEAVARATSAHIGFRALVYFQALDTDYEPNCVRGALEMLGVQPYPTDA